MSRRKMGGGVCSADGRVWIEQLESRNLFSAVAPVAHAALAFAAARAPEFGFSPGIIRRTSASDATSAWAPGDYFGAGPAARSHSDWSSRDNGGLDNFAPEAGGTLSPAIDSSSYVRDLWSGGAANALGFQIDYRPDFQFGGWTAPNFAFAGAVELNLHGPAVHIGYGESWTATWTGADVQTAAPASNSDLVRGTDYSAGTDMTAAPAPALVVMEQVITFATFHDAAMNVAPWAFHMPGEYDGPMGARLPDTDTVIVVGGSSSSTTQVSNAPAPSGAAPVADPASGSKAIAAAEATRAAAAIFRAVEPPTPLALTPAGVSKSAAGSVGAVQTTPSSNAASVNAAVSVSSGALSAARRPAGLAAVFFGTAPLTRQAALVADGVYAATGLLPAADSHVPEALSAMSAPPSLAAQVAYNFLRLDPAAVFPDTIAAFVNEWASIPSAVSQPSAAGAWAVTAAVLGLDAVLLGAWYRRTRRNKQEIRPDAFASQEVHIERLAERWM